MGDRGDELEWIRWQGGKRKRDREGGRASKGGMERDEWGSGKRGKKGKKGAGGAGQREERRVTRGLAGGSASFVLLSTCHVPCQGRMPRRPRASSSSSSAHMQAKGGSFDCCFAVNNNIFYNGMVVWCLQEQETWYRLCLLALPE